jgi:putative Mg2+ transporter-C (MgtC) family protein
LKLFRDLNLKVLNMEITRATGSETHNACAIFALRLNKKCSPERLLAAMTATEGVVSVEEL